MTAEVYRGDNTGAFDQTFLTINLNNPSNKVISKAEFRCGTVLKTFNNPQFPLKINLNEEETEKLTYQNYGYLCVYDEQGRKKTVKGHISFSANGKVV